MANWRSDRETVHFFGPKWPFSAFWRYKNKERLLKGPDVKCHVPSTCLDASKEWFSIVIYSINRASEWLWLEIQQIPDALVWIILLEK